MDSEPPPRSTSRTAAPTGLSKDPTGLTSSDTGDEPYSPGSLFHTAAPLFGVLLGLCTLVVPLATVISDRSSLPSGLSEPTPTASTPATAHGFAQSAGLTGARAGEPDGGDPGREPEQIRVQR